MAIFKSLLIASLCLSNLTFNTLAIAADDIVKIDRIIAVVDKNIITEQELLNRINTVSAQIEKKGKTLPSQAVMQKQILERLIVDSLQLQMAAQTGIKVDDTRLNKTVERLAEQNKMSMEEFKEALANDGIPYFKFREDLRDEITISRLKEREVINRVEVSDGEIDNYLTTQANVDDKQEEFEISHILIRLPEDTTPEDIDEARVKIENLYKELENGQTFEQVSGIFSDTPNALEGGGMGWRKGSQLPTVFSEQLQSMSVGEVAKPIRSPNGFHILKLTNVRSGNSPLMVEQTKVRHILIKLNEGISEKEAKQKMDVIKERLDNGAKFEEMAQQYSEDGSANSGGDLGWVNPGDTVPQFESVMNDLPIGEFSAPVTTPFGWHIIQVLERREKDMTEEAARFKARKEIRNRKAEEAYQDWIGELRDRAFVELRLEDDY